MGREDQAIALSAARTRVLRASEALRRLREVCVRARAVIENAPVPEKLDEAAAQLDRSHQAAQEAVDAAQRSIVHAADVAGARTAVSGVREVRDGKRREQSARR